MTVIKAPVRTLLPRSQAHKHINPLLNTNTIHVIINSRYREHTYNLIEVLDYLYPESTMLSKRLPSKKHNLRRFMIKI